MGLRRWTAESAVGLARLLSTRIDPDPTPSSSPDFLVVGMGRSGTSLIMAMLAAHPEIVMVPDTGALRALAGRLPSAALRRLGGLPSHEAGHGVGFTSGFQLFGDALLRLAPAPGSRVGEKTPTHLEFSLVAGVVWPRTKFIEMRRDVRSVLASRKRATWSSGRSLGFHLLAMRTYQHLGTMTEKALARRHLVVHYEDLVERPFVELTKVCAFLGTTPSPSMLAYQDHAQVLIAPEEQGWKDRILQPIDLSRRHAWRDELSPFETRAVNLTCAAKIGLAQAVSGPGLVAMVVRVVSCIVIPILLIVSLMLMLPLFPKTAAYEVPRLGPNGGRRKPVRKGRQLGSQDT